jgi:hypothetical protein
MVTIVIDIIVRGLPAGRAKERVGRASCRELPTGRGQSTVLIEWVGRRSSEVIRIPDDD